MGTLAGTYSLQDVFAEQYRDHVNRHWIWNIKASEENQKTPQLESSHIAKPPIV